MEKKKKVCIFCGKDVTDDEYCYGCKEYVCEDCDNRSVPFGEHSVRDHEKK